ncbi:MAG: hypothetical protein HC828_04080 [Blastochloris sp.]|nr:hypothetical protein [Blastochloris sp.]
MAKAALQGKTLRGQIPFAAATSGTLALNQLGAWDPAKDDYQVAVEILRRQLWNINVTVVADATEYFVRARNQTYRITSGGGATATSIRDQLIAAIDAPSPGNRLDATIVDADDFSLLGLDGGDELGVSVSANLTLTFGMEAAPNWSVFKQGGQVTVRTVAAFSGAFDVIAQG